jgi:hypothetical protein
MGACHLELTNSSVVRQTSLSYCQHRLCMAMSCKPIVRMSTCNVPRNQPDHVTNPIM